MFRSLFDRDRILVRSRQLGAVQRVRALHPHDVLLALVRCAVGDEHRSIATARRQVPGHRGVHARGKHVYDRLTPALAKLAWEMFLRTLASANGGQRRRIARALGMRVRDIRSVDSSSVTLPARAAAQFPSTDALLGHFEITATLSVLKVLLCDVRVTDARQHDDRA
jgi:hypothetical protein